jgi:1-acyl-sn-glycerol-3-phosphate acyltransferase
MPSAETASAVPLGYRFFRRLVRIWFSLLSCKIRLLRGEALPTSGAALLVVSHPASFRHALVLVAAFERQVHCLLSAELFGGFLRGWLARRLGMIRYQPGDGRYASALGAVCEVLGGRGAVAVFAEQRAGKDADGRLVGLPASTLALEAESRHSRQVGLSLYPVHLLPPLRRQQSGEALIYVGSPLVANDYFAYGSGEVPARTLAGDLEQALRENAFGLRESEVQQFLADLEEVLLTDLEEDWAARANWKQQVNGFRLSEYVVEWAEQANFLHPGWIVALREDLERYREQRRRWSLGKLEVEAAGAWLASSARRGWYWLESVVGFPLACYGLINHLLVWVLLFWAGLLKKESERDRTVEWLMRALVVVGCYSAQVILCADSFGRAAAGYYALTLPLSGAYLWRYEWLLRARTRFLWLRARLPRQAEKMRRARRRLVEELNAARDAMAEALGVSR